VAKTGVIAVSIEAAPKKAFATAVDWPGWSRSGKTEELALEALGRAAPRYAAMAADISRPVPGQQVSHDDFEIVERTVGGSGTDFGVPSLVTDHDRRPLTGAEAERLSRLVDAAWTTFDRISAKTPLELRKGPRGGGRDRDKIIDHVLESDHGYSHEMGLRLDRPSRTNQASIDAMRAAILDLIARPSDGSPLGGRRWPPRYAANRIAWHALDHAWEIEDRTEEPSESG